MQPALSVAPSFYDVGVSTRWRLNRAGIINVYQYSNETLQFGGGRLLLRGVNGSGKSTAMNMLLPFLLDADTRRIDAAGEQSSGQPGRVASPAWVTPSTPVIPLI